MSIGPLEPMDRNRDDIERDLIGKISGIVHITGDTNKLLALEEALTHAANIESFADIVAEWKYDSTGLLGRNRRFVPAPPVDVFPDLNL